MHLDLVRKDTHYYIFPYIYYTYTLQERYTAYIPISNRKEYEIILDRLTAMKTQQKLSTSNQPFSGFYATHSIII